MPLRARDHVHLAVASDPRHFRLIRSAVEAFALEAGLDGPRVHGLVAAVDEACANVVRHAYLGRCDGTLDVRCELAGGQDSAALVVSITDHGCAPPAGGLPAPKRIPPETAGSEAPRPGGLGLALMHHHVDSLTFAAGPDGANVLRLEVRCSKVAGSAEAEPR